MATASNTEPTCPTSHEPKFGGRGSPGGHAGAAQARTAFVETRRACRGLQNLAHDLGASKLAVRP